MRFRLIDAKKADLPVGRMCELLHVSAGGYYAWRRRGPSRRQLDDMVLLAHKEASDELVRCECHGLVPLAALGPVVLPFEGDGVGVEGDEAAIGDGDAVSVAGEISEHGLGPGEGSLDGSLCHGLPPVLSEVRKPQISTQD